MTRLITPFVLLSLLCSSSQILIGSEKRHYELTLKGIDHAYNLELERAINVFERIIREDPKNPHGYVLQMVTYYYKSQLVENKKWATERFKEVSRQALKASKNYLAKSEHQTDALFYMGTAHIYLAAFHGGENNWLRAYWYGKKGISYLERVVSMDPNYYDAYLGLGLYHYYADVLPKFVKTVTGVFGISGDRLRGLKELRLAAEHGTYSRAEALFFLGNIYLYNEKDYDLSLAYTAQLTSRFPRNVGFKLLHGENLQRSGQHQVAMKMYQEVLAAENSARYPFFAIVAQHHLGDVTFELNQFTESLRHYGKVRELANGYSGDAGWAIAWAGFRMGYCYDLLNQRTDALVNYQSVRKSDNKQAYKLAEERMKRPLGEADVDLMLARNYIKTKQYEVAITILERATEKVRNSKDYPVRKLPEIRYHIARARFEKREYREAADGFMKLVRLAGLNESWLLPWSQFYLGRCYQALGEGGQAAKQYELAYQSKDERLRFEIDKLRTRN